MAQWTDFPTNHPHAFKMLIKGSKGSCQSQVVGGDPMQVLFCDED